MRLAIALLVWLALGCEDHTRRVLEAETTPSSSAAPREGPRRVSLFAPAAFRAALGELQEKAGKPRNVFKLVAHTDRIVLHAQDPARPTNLDQYIYRDGKVEGPIPVKLKGTGTLEDNLFAIDEAQLTVVPALVIRAIEAARVEEGAVSKVVVKRDLPRSTDVIFRVHVVGPRRDAVVEADHEGSVIEPRDK